MALAYSNAGLLLVAHESEGVAQAELRFMERGIDLERHAVVRKRVFEAAGHAREFAKESCGLGSLGTSFGIALDVGKCFSNCPAWRKQYAASFQASAN